MGQNSYSRLSQIVDTIEENMIAGLLGIMTLITFANVIARYVFNSNILWALEVTVFLFAWLVLLGASYAVKHSVHIGVDVVLQILPTGTRKLLSLFAAAACILFAVLLLIGSWNYWYPFVTKRAFLETNDVPMPDMLQFLSGWLNEGELYEKLPRFIPYAALPISTALLTYRFIQAGWRVLTDQQESLIAAHEGADLIEELHNESDANTTKTGN